LSGTHPAFLFPPLDYFHSQNLVQRTLKLAPTDWHRARALGEEVIAAPGIVLEERKRMSVGLRAVGRAFALFRERYLGRAQSP